MNPQRTLSPVPLTQKNSEGVSCHYIQDDLTNSLSFSKKKIHYYIAKNLVNVKKSELSPMSSPRPIIDIKKSIKEEENEDEELNNINTSMSDLKEMKNIFNTREKYDPNQFNEMNKGPRFKKNGELISYSIVGKTDSFLKNYNILKNYQMGENMKSSNFLDEIKTPLSALKSNKNDARNNNNLSRKASFRSSNDVISEKNTQTSPNNTKKIMYKKVDKEQLLKELDEFEKKRQLALKNDAEKLAALHLSDRILATKESRIIEKFEKNNEKWKNDIEKLCQSINRSLDQTVMLQYDEYRKNKEKAEEIERLKESLKKRLDIKDERSELFWYLSLRNYPNEDQNLQPRFASHEKCKKIADESALKKLGRLTLLHDLPNGFKTGVVENKTKDIEKIREPFLRHIKGNINKTTNSFTSKKYNVNILDTLNESNENSMFKTMDNKEDELDDLEVYIYK